MEKEEIEVEDTSTDDTETELTVEDYQKEKEWRLKAVSKYVLPAKKLMEKYWVKSFEELEAKISLWNQNAWNVLTEEKQALREEVSEFLLENKDLKEYKTEILKYREQGFTMKQAVALVENDDKTIENRRKTQAMNITDWETAWKSVYTYDELEKMSQSEYNKVKELQLKWKVSFKK